ncbi:uncharacterized protein LOC115403784 [Salarias fasciatus]|uniref:uncharacterized protein LOC115403784 n=1 Tax=Salarias fasciatus TaxID=181472 RepID=UPI0011764AEF|nr:uncharacterized protein LOC115403784 [Salarias fasciatus]
MAFIIFTVYLSLIVRLNHGFEVVQPQNWTVDLVSLASITCEHTAEISSVVDVRLNRISPTGSSSKICPGTQDCIKLPTTGKQQVFLLLNVGPEEMSCTYQCEVTIQENGNIPKFFTEKGTPTKLVQGQQETERGSPPTPSPPSPPSPPPLPPPASLLSRYLSWILIGLLAVTLLYSCAITVLFIRGKFQVRTVMENTTYVEMKKAPSPRR